MIDLGFSCDKIRDSLEAMCDGVEAIPLTKWGVLEDCIVLRVKLQCDNCKVKCDN